MSKKKQKEMFEPEIMLSVMEDLKESEEKYRLLISELPEIVYRAKNDKAWTITYINNQIKNLSGYPPSDFINRKRTYTSLIHPDDQKRVFDEVQKKINKKQAYELEYRIIDSKGKIRWVHEKGKGIFEKSRKLKFLEGLITDITEQKKAEDFLLKEVNFNKTILETTPAFYIAINLDGTLKMSNDALLKELGYTKKEMIGKNMMEFIPKREHEMLSQRFKNLMKGKTGDGSENHLIKKDGTEILTEWKNKFAFKDNKIDFIFGFGTNITAKKKAEEALKKSEERFALAMKGANDGLWDWDLITNEVYFSPRWKSILGYKPNEIKNNFNEWQKKLHPDDLKKTLDYVQNYIKHPRKETYSHEFRMKHKNNTWVNILSRAFLVTNKAGKPIRLVGTHIDLTEQKKAEEKIKESEEQYRSLVENIPDCVWSSNEKGETKFISPIIKDILGYTDKEIYAHPEYWLGRIHPDDIDKVGKGYEDFLAGKKTFDVEYRTQRKDGKWIWLYDRGIKVYRKDGILYADGVFSDITERKKAEEIKNLSLEKLKELDKQKDEFISIAAHELKTPLASLSGFSELLKKVQGSSPEKTLQYSEVINRESKRLIRIVDDILNLSRIDLGTSKYFISNINLKQFIGNITQIMKAEFETKKIKYHYKIQPGIKLKTDKDKLEQILINLLGNALKFTKKGKITLEVKKKGQNIQFIVKDTGIGIARKDQEKIFKRFYQINSAWSRKAQGTGLGLSLCKEYIRILGGEINVKSKLGKGSTFEFYIPIKKNSTKKKSK